MKKQFLLVANKVAKRKMAKNEGPVNTYMSNVGCEGKVDDKPSM
jgi:hypothetical protein